MNFGIWEACWDQSHVDTAGQLYHCYFMVGGRKPGGGRQQGERLCVKGRKDRTGRWVAQVQC